MKMDGNIRVATDVKYKELYSNIKNNGAVKDFHELFFVCACLGYRNGVSTPIKKRDDRFWSSTITPKEWVCYYAMILEKNNFDYTRIADDKDVITVIEGYTNAGMEILIKEFLGDYLRSNSNGADPQLDPSCCKELSKQFVHFIFEQSDQ